MTRTLMDNARSVVGVVTILHTCEFMNDKETCIGIEQKPEAFFTTGCIPWAPKYHSCRWIRVGRMRLGWYGGVIIRPRFARYKTGWQITILNSFMSWTYRTLLIALTCVLYGCTTTSQRGVVDYSVDAFGDDSNKPTILESIK